MANFPGSPLNDSLIGEDTDDILNGFDGNDTLIGLDGSDTLIGGRGADQMEGGAGDDTYYVDNTGDLIFESAENGTDHVIASITTSLRALSKNLETLTLSDDGDIKGTGNGRDNLIIGNSGDNRLNGAWGDDTLIGGAGNDVLRDADGADRLEGGTGDDTYFVDNVGDTLFEEADAGTDHVNSSISFALRKHSKYLETLTLIGHADIDGTGNGRFNLITGNDGDNVLNGAWGNDTLIGGAGNDTFRDVNGADQMEGGLGDDTYYVDDVDDIILEAAGEGIDQINAASTYQLPDEQEIENLRLLGSDGIFGVGNALNNMLSGNSGDNRLNGAAGDDTLFGGDGADTFIFDGQVDADVVSDYALGQDKLNISATLWNGEFTQQHLDAISSFGIDGLQINLADGNSIRLEGIASSAGLLSDISLTTPFGIEFTDSARVSSPGYLLSSAGDVNGDGLDDILIGAPNVFFGGRSYIVFGKAADFGTSFDLSSLDGTNGFNLQGIDNRDSSGSSVSNAGDVNGDGIDDIIIGAALADHTGRPSAGESYIVFGSTDGFDANIRLSSLNGDTGFILKGADEGDRTGEVGFGGDINGDGLADIISTAPSAGPGGLAGGGETTVIFGSVEPFASRIFLSELDGSNDFVILGDRLQISSATSAGDLNGDGQDDIIINVRSVDQMGLAGTGPHEFHVIYGSIGVFAPSFDLTSLNGTNGFVIGNAGSDRALQNADVATVDFNGDGISDVVFGAVLDGGDSESPTGRAYVLFGSASGYDARIDVSELDGTNGLAFEGINPLDATGSSVASAGDVNGDGIDDILIGASGADPNGVSAAGSTYLVFGSSNGFDAQFDLASLDGTNGFVFDGFAPGDWVGQDVSSAGDFNGDGNDDILIRTNQSALSDNVDKVFGGANSYLVFGGAEALGRFDEADGTQDGRIGLSNLELVPSDFDLTLM